LLVYDEEQGVFFYWDADSAHNGMNKKRFVSWDFCDGTSIYYENVVVAAGSAQ
jgi:hypothetical protein